MAELSDIVRRAVLDALREALGQPAQGTPVAASSLPCVLVLAQREAALEARVAPLVAGLYPRGADIRFQGEDLGGRVPARHILPYLACSDMADLATGRASGAAMKAVLDLLLRGVTVEVLEFAYEAYAQSAPIPLHDLYAGYERVLAGFGLRRFAPAPPDQVKVHATLISAAVVERAAATGTRELVVPAGAIVTPLAVDAAKAMGVAILKQSQGQR